VTTVVEPGECLESAPKHFTRPCSPGGLLSEVEKRHRNEKPSARRKREALAARKKARRRERVAH